jgi:RimJ/RimL family protein N-acetyltransferase
MEIREAKLEDWSKLEIFFKRIYRVNHPLHSYTFWEWQYGDGNFGRSFICIDKDIIVGHVGANFGGGIAWIINVYLDENYRGKGILSNMYSLARNYYPLAATAGPTRSNQCTAVCGGGGPSGAP